MQIRNTQNMVDSFCREAATTVKNSILGGVTALFAVKSFQGVEVVCDQIQGLQKLPMGSRDILPKYGYIVAGTAFAISCARICQICWNRIRWEE